MNNQDIRQEVGDLINTLKAHFDGLANQSQIPQEELITLLDKVETLYRKMVVLNHLGAVSENIAEGLLAAPLKETGIITPEVPTEEVLLEAEPVIENQEEIIESKPEEHLPVAEANIIADLKEETVSIPVTVEKERVEEPEIKIEEVKSVPKKQLADLKSGIGINDKFQFIAELFAASGDKYEEAIKRLNTFETMQSSLLYLEELRAQYGWKEDADTAQRLTDLVKRRFI